jgi:hypothetical protein
LGTAAVESVTFFGLLLNDVSGIPQIRILNPELCEFVLQDAEVFALWLEFCQSSVRFLLNFSQYEATDLLSCTSVDEMIAIVFKLYSNNPGLYNNVNRFLRGFPVNLISKLMRQLRGIVSYVYLLQSSIEQWSLRHPLLGECVVYRGFPSNGEYYISLYQSVIGELIVWRSFTSTSLDRETVISSFVGGPDGLLFEISLHAGDVAALLAGGEILIGAWSGFIIDSVDKVSVVDSQTGDEFIFPRIHLTYFTSWHEFDLDAPPPRLIV